MSSAATFLYLQTRGRKSGLPRRIEIWFVEHEARFYLVAQLRARAGFVKNLQACDQVELSIGTREAPASVVPAQAATARCIDPEREPELAQHICALMDAKYDWSSGLIVELSPNPNPSPNPSPTKDAP